MERISILELTALRKRKKVRVINSSRRYIYTRAFNRDITDSRIMIALDLSEGIRTEKWKVERRIASSIIVRCPVSRRKLARHKIALFRGSINFTRSNESSKLSRCTIARTHQKWAECTLNQIIDQRSRAVYM